MRLLFSEVGPCVGFRRDVETPSAPNQHRQSVWTLRTTLCQPHLRVTPPPALENMTRIMTDKENTSRNKPKGYGFADYMDANLMDAAVRLLNGRDVHGRPIRVDFADHSDRERIRGEECGWHTPSVGRPRHELVTIVHELRSARGSPAVDGVAHTAQQRTVWR